MKNVLLLLSFCMCVRARASVSMGKKKTFANAPDVHLQILGLRARQKGRRGTGFYLNDSSVQVPVMGEVAATVGFIFQFSIEAIVWGSDLIFLKVCVCTCT